MMGSWWSIRRRTPNKTSVVLVQNKTTVQSVPVGSTDSTTDGTQTVHPFSFLLSAFHAEIQKHHMIYDTVCS